MRHEHERWDGTGYPDGLAGKAIPIGSRIILACDAEAVEELRRGAGSQFDPAVVVALLQVLGAS